ncbi:alpha/beta fold hydrolase [Glycomyces harbinensis]|uniref:Alpha/beta hydrolase family protein n=1 Tax=Glycomyces harbinensis TaxID=58114 RepID=A0A1G6ZMY9_9ACTN|nr:alpha/beta hydrolase [Glycomyces harbinensis]SDE03577.1 Alpha/beta hydrolase family protein [Glycomyces harbinensis]
MTTFLLIHGAGDSGFGGYWHLVQAELEARGHEAIAPDLPADDPTLTLQDYADAALAAVEDRADLVVVGHSFGAFTAPLVAARVPVKALVLVAGMIPAPGEPGEDWWDDTGCNAAVREQAALDGGLTGSDDPYVAYYHDVPRAIAARALSKERDHPSWAAYVQPWPLEAWPDVPTRFVLCTEDRVFPPDFMRGLVKSRLGIVPDEIAASHCVALSLPRELSDLLERSEYRGNADRE